MLKSPSPDPGAFMKLHSFLKRRKREKGFAVVVFGLLEKPEEYNGHPLHGIFWIVDVFKDYKDAEFLVDEIMNETGMNHVKIIQIGESDLLTTAIDPDKTRTVFKEQDRVITSIEKQNISEQLKQKQEEERIRQAILEEEALMNNTDSSIYYGHVWLRYIQNRSIREQAEKSLQNYLKIENERREELRKLYQKHPEYEKIWLSDFSDFRKRMNENSTAEQIEKCWIAFRRDIFPDLWV